ncbi:alpha-glucosidase [Carnobacterium inhibens]|uniref:alpha-glucosidase n=1 Tax=Carnobacterium inhibens TaxID=147709 RepID=UPI0030B860C8
MYPRSFKDTTNNGIGDIRGIMQNLPYLQQLGVDTLWVNPVIESAQEDYGYDVSDYYAIDPLFGTMAEAKAFIKEVHKRGMKIIFDFPMNHTSDQHYWFQEALKGPDNPYRDFYIWADAPEDKDFPNNWASNFSGSAWTKEPNGNQFYLHLFKESMPDLNWSNLAVRKAMLSVAKYWIDNGIDGFRFDAFIYIDKPEDLPDDKSVSSDEFGSGQKVTEYGTNLKIYLQELISELKKHKKDLFIIGEATTADNDTALTYLGAENNLLDAIITFTYFPEVDAEKDARLPAKKLAGRLDKQKFKTIMSDWQKKVADKKGAILYWNSHDSVRGVSRFGDDEAFRDNSSKMLATLMYLQQGIPLIYYGEEIGQKNLVYEDIGKIETPGVEDFYTKAKKIGYSDESILYHLNHVAKDVARGIMQWDSSKYAGFSTVKPWIGWYQEEKYNVADQEADSDSILNYYRKLLFLKKESLFIDGSFDLKDSKETLYIYERLLEDQKALIYCNFSDTSEVVQVDQELQKSWSIAIQNDGNLLDGTALTLAPFGAIVFRK